jgi:LysM repeat protein
MLGFTLLLGAFLLPTERAHAGLIANLFSNKASADSIEIISPSSPSNNSQNLSLLESTVSSASLVDKDDAGDAEGVIQPDKNVAITDNALVPATGPLGIAGEVEAETPSSDQISIYVVREGDSLASIAKMFGVTTNTILWSNNIQGANLNGERLKEKTVAIVGGQGQGSARTTAIRTGTNQSASNDYEIFVDARSNTSTELNSIGDAKLADAEARTNIDVDIAPSSGYVYRRDYGLGDLVTVSFADTLVVKKINVVEVAFDQDQNVKIRIELVDA